MIKPHQKKTYADTRREGFSVKEAGDKAGVSYPSARKLEEQRRSGELETEVMQALKTEGIESLIQRCLNTLVERDVAELPTSQVVAILSKSLTAYNRIRPSSEDDDDIDKIYREIQQEMRS